MRVGYFWEWGDQDAMVDAVTALEAAGCNRVVIESAPRRRTGANSAFAALISRMQPGDSVVVLRLEHLADGLPTLLERLASITHRGARVEALSGELDTIDPAVAGAISSLHAFSVRVRIGAKAQQPDAVHAPGRPRRLIGEDVVRARQLLEAGRRSVGEVARELGVSRATLYRSLKET